MCNNGTKPNTHPSNGGGSTPGGGPVVVCPTPDSAITLLDEIGLPFKNLSVQVSIGGAPAKAMSTDGDGKISFTKPPGTAVEVTMTDTHETRPGDSTSTPSGQHFGRLKPGP